ncbi:hypothetical protein [Chelatococcus sp. XZ-Ab1]|uniref:hypothetical protein n=1 Tax=Chelatococcus sp. XZ-Ab1 TaxID=3034027 RepID=UPI0023E471CC|nr:hypothetical protein [Chelatococcus sp. XZ-Ab1]
MPDVTALKNQAQQAASDAAAAADTAEDAATAAEAAAQLLATHVLPDGTDFNALDQRGTYIMTSETNAPLPGATNRWVIEEVADPTDADRVVQRAYLLVGGAKLELANRRRLAGGSWQAWLVGAGQAIDVGFDDSVVYQGSPNVQAALVASANYTGYVETQATLQSFVYGLTGSNNASDPNNDIDFAPGQARGNGVTATLASTLTKRLDAAWAVGNNQGALDTGSKAANQTYHWHLIRRNSDGLADVIASLSATSPSLPSEWTRVQRLGAVLTDGSGNIQPFVQSGNEFRFNTTDPTPDYSGAGNRAKAALTCTLPNGIRVQGIFSVFIRGASGDFQVRARLFDGANANIASTTAVYVSTGVKSSTAELRQYTNTSRQIQLLIDQNADPSSNSTVTTLGWTDYQIPRIGA